MSLRTFLSAMAITVALASTSLAQSPQPPEASLHRLRNAAAADVALALKQFAESKKMAVTVVAEPITNSVVVASDAATHKQLVAILEAIDKQPPQIHAEILIIQVPSGFAEDIGLGDMDKTEETWELTKREIRMLNAALRQAKKDGIMDVLSRPQLTVADNQPAFVEVGSGESQKVTARVTPRVISDSVLVNIETRVEKPTGKTGETTTSAMRTTAKIPDGGTLVMRAAKVIPGEDRELLLIMTIHTITH